MFGIRPRVSFVVVGAQKSGTTALFHFLSQHPDIVVPDAKELHFFDDDSLNWDRPNYRLYERRFRKAKNTGLLGEATPCYIYWPQALERLYDYNPRVKVIALFRDPVERAHAQWRMIRGRGVEDLSFSEAIREGRKRLEGLPLEDPALRRLAYVERGFYAWQVERLLDIFPRRHTLLLRQEDLSDAHDETLSRVLDFLGVRDMAIPQSRVFVGEDTAPPSPEDVAYLSELYADDVARFTALTGLDTSAWAPSRWRAGTLDAAQPASA